MSNRTYIDGQCGHRVFFDPATVNLREWWCPKCNKSFKLTPQEKKLVMVAYKYGRERSKSEIKTAIKNLLGIY